MNKLQFLEILGQKLSEELPRSRVISNLQYYESYIEGAVRAGKPEKEVLEELGDPYMIARTILDTETGEAFYEEQFAEDAEFVQTETTYSEKDGKYTADSNKAEDPAAYRGQNYGGNAGAGSASGQQTYTKTETRSESVYQNEKNRENVSQDSDQGQWEVYHTKSNHGCLLMTIVLILVVVVAVTVVGRVVSFLWPVLVPVLLILLIVSVFSDKRK
ncbi:MAG: DUF1700 domain-containing protein [Lachnospiraceae bacterium]|nr:DUF1700 domain-containing protein [Lachnospiraceae bacterium]